MSLPGLDRAIAFGIVNYLQASDGVKKAVYDAANVLRGDSTEAMRDEAVSTIFYSLAFNEQIVAESEKNLKEGKYQTAKEIIDELKERQMNKKSCCKGKCNKQDNPVADRWETGYSDV